MLHLFTGLNLSATLLLILALIFVLFYESINGFHDTANAVATVIYTRAMRARLAVVMSGIFNFFGVMFGGLSVAYAIVHMLPTDLLLNVGSTHGLAMVFSILLAAIIWNLLTWYLGIPASSSHTLIGTIMGIGLTNVFIHGVSLFDAINLKNVINILLSLIISPIVGLLISGSLIFLLRRYWSGTKKRARIHMTPNDREKIDGKRKPPFWTRIILIASALGVSYSHGANDGQKGIGLIMLVLIGVAPAGFAVNMHASDYEITTTKDAINHLEEYYKQHMISSASKDTLQILRLSSSVSQYPEKKFNTNNWGEFYCKNGVLQVINHAREMFNNLQSYNQLLPDQRTQMRRILLCLSDIASKAAKLANNPEDKIFLNKLNKDLLSTIEYAPVWIIVAIAQALSIGTMIGWRRVAVTIGEKIGKKDMTYAQGMSAQVTAAISIGIASYTGMPVSTTHILSSSVAGSMLIDGWGLQIRTIKNIVMAWILTLPICILLSSLLYWITLSII